MQEIFNKKMDLWLGERGKIALAVSGGADSMAMAVLAARFAAGRCAALVVDHGLREGSTKEAKLVAGRLRALGLTAHVLTWRGKIPTSNIEAAAREYRYRLLCDWVKAHGFDALAVAHQMDEQAETLMLNLLRGSGLAGLSGMAEIGEMRGVRVLRPLLEFRKEELVALLLREQVEWVSDPMNADDRFARVRVRKAIAALGLPVERIALAAENLRRAREAVDYYVDEASEGELSVEGFRALPREVAYRVLARRLGGDYGPRLASIERLYARLLTPGFRGATLGGYKIRVRRDEIIFEREKRGRGG